MKLIGKEARLCGEDKVDCSKCPFEFKKKLDCQWYADLHYEQEINDRHLGMREAKYYRV
jgi:hypothetical protein